MQNSRLMMQRLLARAPLLVTVLAVLLIAQVMATLTWQWLGDKEDLTAVWSASSFTVSSLPGQREGLDRLASLQLLGRAEPVEQIAVVIDAPETRLNLQLKGIFSDASDVALARALIGEGSREERVYRVGERISGDTVLHEIHADRVILRRAGRFETLTLPKERMDITPTAGVPQSPTPGVQQLASPQGVAQQLRDIRSGLLQNPQEALQYIQLQPVMIQGQLQGYSVRPGQDRRLFSSIGLRPGDVVTAVNGVSLNDPGQLAVLYQELSLANTLTIAIERRGRSTELTLNLE